jgi:hypothetical protein
MKLFTDKRENAVPHRYRHGHLKMKITPAVSSYIGISDCQQINGSVNIIFVLILQQILSSS